MAESRRVKLTKRLIKEALIELLEEKPANKVTVTDICTLAEVNRSTFYAYYEDVPMLLGEVQEELISSLPSPEMLPIVFGSLGKFFDRMEELFDFVKSNSRIFSVLIAQPDGDEFAERVVRAVLARYPRNFFAEDSLEMEYRVFFCLHGFIGIFKQWIMEDFPISSREFAELALSMAAACAGLDISD